MKRQSSEVTVYHDETKDAGDNRYKGHALFFVPSSLAVDYSNPLFGGESFVRAPAQALDEKILAIRRQYGLDPRKLHFSDISGQRWTRFDAGLRCVVDSAVDALRHRYCTIFKAPLCCKLAVAFYLKKPDLSLYGGTGKKEQGMRHDETVLRMLLKGALHYLYGESNKVVLNNVITDGQPSHRTLDDDRVLRQLSFDGQSGRSKLRDYVTIAPSAQIVHLQSDHTLYDLECQERLHADFLQVTDLLLGAVIRSCYVDMAACARVPAIGSHHAHKKDAIAYPVWEMLEKKNRGKGFARSGHSNSFSITMVTFEQETVRFKQMSARELRTSTEGQPLRFGLM